MNSNYITMEVDFIPKQNIGYVFFILDLTLIFIQLYLLYTFPAQHIVVRYTRQIKNGLYH